MRIALLIDSPPNAPYHAATVAAIEHAANALDVTLDLRVHTTDAVPSLDALAGVVIGPGSPYRDERAVWDVVRTARERRTATSGPCGTSYGRHANEVFRSSAPEGASNTCWSSTPATFSESEMPPTPSRQAMVS